MKYTKFEIEKEYKDYNVLILLALCMKYEIMLLKDENNVTYRFDLQNGDLEQYSLKDLINKFFLVHETDEKTIFKLRLLSLDLFGYFENHE